LEEEKLREEVCTRRIAELSAKRTSFEIGRRFSDEVESLSFVRKCNKVAPSEWRLQVRTDGVHKDAGHGGKVGADPWNPFNPPSSSERI
jgi:hypothetical protein